MTFRELHQPSSPGEVSEDDIRDELSRMEKDPHLNTKISLEKDDGATLRLMTFQEKHLAVLRKNPKINPVGYLANLQTMIKIRK